MFIIRLMMLPWAHIFTECILWMMMLYFTDVWKLDYTHAAAIINIWMGSALVWPVVLTHLADAFIGHFYLLVLTGLSYATGLGMLWISTPPILSKTSGNNCTAYSPECTTDQAKAVLYTGLALVSLGSAGLPTSYIPFATDQSEHPSMLSLYDEYATDCSLISRYLINSFYSTVWIPLAGVLVAGYVKSWAIQFGVCALLFTVALLVFLSGVRSFNRVRPLGSFVTTLFRVFAAAFSKRRYQRPDNVYELYRKFVGFTLAAAVPHTKGFSYLENAAIVVPEQSLAQQEANPWRLCSVTEVEETKSFLRTIPMSLTSILCGFTSALSHTFFLEQAKHLNTNVGNVKIPLILFIFFFQFTGLVFFKLFKFICKIFFCKSNDEDFEIRLHTNSPVGVAVVMVFSVLCCITAAKVEGQRLNKQQDQEIRSMSIFVLLPQFALLWEMERNLTTHILGRIIRNKVNSAKKFVSLFLRGVHGIGIMGSILLVHIVQKTSDWFQSELNESRLDNYYWVLAIMGVANIVLHVVIGIFYHHKNKKVDSDQSRPPNLVEMLNNRTSDAPMRIHLQIT